jgi:hypothetical protein
LDKQTNFPVNLSISRLKKSNNMSRKGLTDINSSFKNSSHHDKINRHLTGNSIVLGSQPKFVYNIEDLNPLNDAREQRPYTDKGQG